MDFRSIDEPWRLAFELAWEAFRAGSIPVGAIVVDPAGGVVATGRNRFNEPTAPAGQLAGGHLAHAEVNALAVLPPGSYRDHTLYTTLEPCLLCTSALRYSHVGSVRFAASDPMWYGMDRLPEINHHIARRWSRRIGPLEGWLATWGALFPLVSAVERGIRSVVECHAEAMPEVLRLARWVAEPARLRQLRAAPLSAALDELTPMIEASFK